MGVEAELYMPSAGGRSASSQALGTLSPSASPVPSAQFAVLRGLRGWAEYASSTLSGRPSASESFSGVSKVREGLPIMATSPSVVVDVPTR